MPIPKGWSEKKLKKVRCDKRSIRTKILSKNRRILVCCPAGHWSARSGRCKVGTRGYALLTRKR